MKIATNDDYIYAVRVEMDGTLKCIASCGECPRYKKRFRSFVKEAARK